MSINNAVELHRLDHGLAPPGEIEQVMGNFPDPVHLVDDLGQAVFGFRGVRGSVLFIKLEQPLGFLPDDGQGIVDFMGDAGGELPDGSQFLGLQQLLVA